MAFEDDDVLVVDKPAGMVVHPAPGQLVRDARQRAEGTGDAAVRRVRHERGRGSSTGWTRRRPGSSSSPKVTERTECLGAALQARQITRRYAALTWGHLTEDRVTIDRPIARDPRDRKRMAVVTTGRPARTDLTRLARFDSVDLLRAHLHSGRTHQIRVHARLDRASGRW